MGRLLVLIAVVVAVAWLLRRALARAAPPDASTADAPSPSELVQCAHCGMHLPRSEARVAQGHSFCCDDHAARGPGANS